jgi:3-oxoacyl-[acyl-carrier protein] reductase
MAIFITGGSRGIGNNIVMTALKKGHDVAFTYRNPETDVAKLLAAAKEAAPDAKCMAYQMDVSDSAQVGDTIFDVLNDFDTIHAVVNCAGMNKNGLAFSMSDGDWADVIQTNLTGPFYVIREFLPHFLSNGKGRFVTVSSISKDGMAGQVNYSASKAGLIGLSAGIAKEYGQKNITSNVVVPGFFETDMTKGSMTTALKEFWNLHCPLKRMGELEELSNTILFLASDEASFINGQAINVTGGLDWAG